MNTGHRSVSPAMELTSELKYNKTMFSEGHELGSLYLDVKAGALATLPLCRHCIFRLTFLAPNISMDNMKLISSSQYHHMITHSSHEYKGSGHQR